ncbi:hypothetical protein V6N13_059737 [Hibiscus sabdariffa]|uniref:DUF4228 domain protein n=1 Tax=Hibiscus sabdariffa TaxID=183260 RepID=A0ABR2GCJ9_9ROSI
MGNWLVVEEKVIRVMEPDGRILEYEAPISAQQVLSNFSGHALSDSLTGFHRLPADAKLLSGQLYYLVPLPTPSKKSKKKVVSKQEVQELLQVSAQDMVSQIQSKQSTNQIQVSGVEDDDNCRGSNSKPISKSF